MKIFSVKRLIGAAALYGIVRYVKANGGPKAVLDDLKLKVNDVIGSAKTKTDTNFATNTGRGTSPSDGASTPDKPTTYASYKVDDERNLH